jgi:hypothetical protein
MKLRRALRRRAPELIIIAATLEFTASHIPFLTGEFVVDERRVSVLDAGKITLLATFALFLLASDRPSLRTAQRPLERYLVLVSYAAIITAILGATGGFNSIARLAAFVAFATIIVALRSGWATQDFMRRAIRPIIIWAAVLSVFAVVQRLTGVWIWNHDMKAAGRANATFADPNLLARFIVVAVALVPLAHLRHRAATTIVLLAGIASTGSRSGVVVLGAVAILGVIIGQRRERRFYGALALGAMSLLPFIWERLARLSENFSAGSGGRTALISDGFAAWTQRPIVGCGLRCFPEALSPEAQMRLDQFHVGLRGSHTSFVTILVELGVVGLVIVAVTVFRPVLGNRLRSGYAPILIALTALVLSSQMEGRLLEDPTLWYLLAWAQVIMLTKQSKLANASSPFTTTKRF